LVTLFYRQADDLHNDIIAPMQAILKLALNRTGIGAIHVRILSLRMRRKENPPSWILIRKPRPNFRFLAFLCLNMIRMCALCVCTCLA
jgi:hypothetical protein